MSNLWLCILEYYDSFTRTNGWLVHLHTGLCRFFEEILNAHGPLHVDDKKLTSLIEDFPNDAKEKIEQVGGLSSFLRQSLKFAMINDYVCLLKDSVKARDISLAQGFARQTLSNSSDSSDNVWKTVGKHSNSSRDQPESCRVVQTFLLTKVIDLFSSRMNRNIWYWYSWSNGW